VTPAQREALWRARRRLDPLGLSPEPVRLDGVRILVVPWLFKVPGFRRFRGYATRRPILLKRPVLDERLMSTSCATAGSYRRNRYEAEARRAAGQAP
jgi:hypothetical protein